LTESEALVAGRLSRATGAALGEAVADFEGV